MRQNWDIAGNRDLEEELLQPWRGHVMGWLDQDVPRVREGQQVTGSNSAHEIRDNVVVSAGEKPKGEAGCVDFCLEVGDGCANLRASIRVNAWKNMRCACDRGHAVVHPCPCHVQRHLYTFRTVIDAR